MIDPTGNPVIIFCDAEAVHGGLPLRCDRASGHTGQHYDMMADRSWNPST